MFTYTRASLLLALIVVSALFAGCGGGGESNPLAQPTPQGVQTRAGYPVAIDPLLALDLNVFDAAKPPFCLGAKLGKDSSGAFTADTGAQIVPNLNRLLPASTRGGGPDTQPLQTDNIVFFVTKGDAVLGFPPVPQVTASTFVPDQAGTFMVNARMVIGGKDTIVAECKLTITAGPTVDGVYQIEFMQLDWSSSPNFTPVIEPGVQFSVYVSRSTSPTRSRGGISLNSAKVKWLKDGAEFKPTDAGTDQWGEKLYSIGDLGQDQGDTVFTVIAEITDMGQPYSARRTFFVRKDARTYDQTGAPRGWTRIDVECSFPAMWTPTWQGASGVSTIQGAINCGSSEYLKFQVTPEYGTSRVARGSCFVKDAPGWDVWIGAKTFSQEVIFQGYQNNIPCRGGTKQVKISLVACGSIVPGKPTLTYESDYAGNKGFTGAVYKLPDGDYAFYTGSSIVINRSKSDSNVIVYHPGAYDAPWCFFEAGPAHPMHPTDPGWYAIREISKSNICGPVVWFWAYNVPGEPMKEKPTIPNS